MPNFRPLSTRSFNLQPITFSRRSFSINAPVLSSSSSSSTGTLGFDESVTSTRQIGKVSRPARSTPLPTGPPKRKYPKPLPLSLPRSDELDFLAKVPAIRNRPTLINEESCRALVRAWGVDKMGDDVTVVDTYAGAGGLSRAFLELPNVKRLITIEDAFRYNPIIRVSLSPFSLSSGVCAFPRPRSSTEDEIDCYPNQKMREEEEVKNPGRMKLVEMDSFTWEAYSEAAKHLDLVPTIPWDQGPNNHLFLAAQLPNNRHGEGMFVQLVTAIASKMWYFTRGRFSMGFVGSENYWKKIFAQPGESAHHKLSVLLPCLAHLEYVQTMTDFRPVESHFHKPRMDPAHVKAIKVTPRSKPLVQNYDALDYVAKHMFVGKAMPWPKAIAAITPGSANLIPSLVEQGLHDLEKPVTKLTMEEWVKIANTFEDWPFRPSNLMDIWGSDDTEY
ncbi:RNA polymerase specificity factor [Sporobolomyces salmoneus]|uniref:RNA polymerase specificity factor n=1 Tax=Sporobolomyces salmoneus TaxID=183962 RepID=UPI0031826A71